MDWKPIIDEALRHLKALLRFDTTNPPGNEILCAQYLRDVLEAEGIEAQLLEAAPGRANLIARLAGSGRAGGPLLLTSHTDVVPAEPGHWRYPPFEATEADGFVWGRGAVDMKQMTAYNLAALLMLKRSGATLTRDVIFAAVADEEAGCRFGSTWLVDQHPELVRAEFGLNEVGGFQLHLGRRYLYPVQVAEKGFLWLRMTVHGEPGHGSMPHDRNAVVKLAAILERVHRRQLPVHIHPVAAAFVREAAETLGFPAKPLLYALLQPMATHALLKILPDRDKAKAFNAMLRNTVTPTGLEAGRKENVIPGQASCILDCRILPGQTTDDLLRELRALVGEPVEIEVIASASPHVVSTDTALYRLIERVVGEHDPAGRVVPYLTVGFTDSCNYARLGITCYGFTPLQLPPDLSFSALFHGHNERIPVDGFGWGVRTFCEVVRRFVLTDRGSKGD